jgi:hypothetical protein
VKNPNQWEPVVWPARAGGGALFEPSALSQLDFGIAPLETTLFSPSRLN